MKHFLLLSLATASALSLSATIPMMKQDIVITAQSQPVKPSYVKKTTADCSRTLAKGVKLKNIGAEGLHTIKRIELTKGTKAITPQRKGKAMKSATLPEGASFFESFEDWDGTTLNWVPDGWTIKSDGEEGLSENEKWGVGYTSPEEGLPAASDGNYVAAIYFSMEFQQDEWLITPEIQVKENEILSFDLYAVPFFFYNLEKIDWDTYEFIGEREIICNVEVWAQSEGEEWQQVWDYMSKFANMSGYDILMATPSSLETQTVSLADFVGKTVKLAFRYVGLNGDSVFLDAVTVGLPSLEGVCYTNPFETLYWGYDRQAGWGSLSLGIAQYPVLAPITWMNNTWNDAATYSWTYHDPETNDFATADDQEQLTVTYRPDYTSDFTTRNNWYYPPTLHASAPGASDSEYTAPYSYLQAGGKSEYLFEGESEPWEVGLLPFDHNSEGETFTIIDDDVIGDMALPIFGHNVNTDSYWLNYTLNGEAPGEGDYVHLNAIMNYILPASAPLVVTGVHVLGLGKISENAEFQVEIVTLNDEGVPDMENPLVSATCTGTDVIIAEGGTNNYLTIPFDFETPVVIDNSNTGYMVKFSGFNSPEVEYFTPLQSAYPNPDYMCFGWLVKEINVGGWYAEESYSPIANFEGDFGECYNGFAINLCGFYPWLDSEVEDIEVSPDGTPVTVPLSSYYDGSLLTVDCPAGIEAKVEGRYGNCVLTVAHNAATVIADGTLTVTAPGVEKSFTLKESSAINTPHAEASLATPVAAFTPDGRQLSPSDAKGGLFIIRYSDGTVRKVSVK